jgi:hypothetical protein
MSRKKVPALALPFQERWRIAEMDLWDQDAVDLVEPGSITFKGQDGDALHCRARLARRQIRHAQWWADCRILMGRRR